MSSGSGVQRIEVASPSEFEEALQANKDKASKVFLLFTGERDEDGKSWCPDCVSAEPVIDRVLAGEEDALLMVCWVKRSEYRGNPDYPYRTHPKIKLPAIPCLMRWGRNSAVGKLVEADCADEGRVRDMTL